MAIKNNYCAGCKKIDKCKLPLPDKECDKRT